ncbi:hypothetical protein [Bradyrhizobium sp. McL0616]|uniref:hypothetical protein n=1 Tax=Bradyrhizobium sp. McL0616 TaxID=3415674 RepID=UPI003CF24563
MKASTLKWTSGLVAISSSLSVRKPCRSANSESSFFHQDAVPVDKHDTRLENAIGLDVGSGLRIKWLYQGNLFKRYQFFPMVMVVVMGTPLLICP